MLVQRSISVLQTSAFYHSFRSVTTLSYPFRACKIRAFGTGAFLGKNGTEADTFLAEENVSWPSLGISDCISRALCDVGLHRPSLVQAACVPMILEGSDVVVAAETGSGKTHGYLVPLIHKLSSRQDVSESAPDDPKLKRNRCVSLVLCPNVMLCEQVVRMANSLCGNSGVPLLRATAICGRQGLSVKEPDIIVSTPVALLNYLYTIERENHSRADLMRAVKYVVFDEADLLLCGSFQNQVIRLIHMLRFDEKQLSRLQSESSSVTTLSLHDSDEERDVQSDLVHGETADGDGDDDDVSAEDSETESQLRNREDWRRARKAYVRSKQYIFVAATLPVNGKATAGGILKRMFPEANWVSGSYLHRQSPRLEQKWIEVTTDTQVEALVNAVTDGPKVKTDSASGVLRTMVFANTVEAVEAVAKILMGAGIGCVRYHRNMSLEERTKNLVDFQQKGGIFVCTDAAARGLDIPNISHVIQAEFATSAVDFLHRVGRTARAGEYGLVTSLFTEMNRDLVNAVRSGEEQGLPVEKAFSRKRSFRKKLKKNRGSSERKQPSIADFAT